MAKKYSKEEGERLIREEIEAKRARSKRLGDKAYNPKRDGPKVRFTRNQFADPERIREQD